MISKVVFVTSPANQNAGSKLLRSDQLRRLAASVLTTRDVPTVTADNTDFSDAILILGKYPLLGANPQTIADSKRRGNLVYADPLDGQVADEVLAAADVLIASSSTQSADFARRFTRQRTAYVGHHVDLRIGPVQSPSDMLRLGYFGEMFNARFAEELSDEIGFHRIDTSRASDVRWIAQLPRYNAHYALRARQSSDGFKPFTKGFVAAHCGAVIVVAADDEEARAFLPADYPYMTAGASVHQVRDVIERMRADFNGPNWRHSLAAMAEIRASSSRDVVARQLFEAVAPDLKK
jgi:hypothetical protein